VGVEAVAVAEKPAPGGGLAGASAGIGKKRVQPATAMFGPLPVAHPPTEVCLLIRASRALEIPFREAAWALRPGLRNTFGYNT